MAEGGVGTSPQVFVVDSQTPYVSMPSEKKPLLARVSQKCLLLLVGLALLGLVVEGYFIYNLNKKTTELALLSSSKQQGLTMGQVGGKESNEIPILQQHTQLPEIPDRPFAHLIGSGSPLGDNNVVQWVSEGGEAVTRNMSYVNGRLIVQKEGYYYIYSKIQFNAPEECSLNQHNVMKDTKAYGYSIELMKSKSFRCKKPNQSPKPKEQSQKPSDAEDMVNSFLGGIFHLQKGDQIFVSLDQVHGFRSGTTYNFMGAFMIA